MSERPTGQMTLHELFVGAERHVRELVEHLDLDFVPKAESFARQLEHRGRPDSEGKRRRTDPATTRNQTDGLLKSERYTTEVYGKLDRYLQAIDASASRIVAGE